MDDLPVGLGAAYAGLGVGLRASEGLLMKSWFAFGLVLRPLGVVLGRFICFFWRATHRPNVSTGTPKITKNRQKTKKKKERVPKGH